MATISERIVEALSARGMKQADLSQKTGIGKSSISTYITGEYEPKQRNLYKMAKALNVDPTWLMGEDVPMEGSAAHECSDHIEVPSGWALPLIHAYCAATPPIQKAACAVLGIPRVVPAEDEDELVEDEYYGYKTIAANDDGVPREIAQREIQEAIREIHEKYGGKNTGRG